MALPCRVLRGGGVSSDWYSLREKASSASLSTVMRLATSLAVCGDPSTSMSEMSELELYVAESLMSSSKLWRASLGICSFACSWLLWADAGLAMLPFWRSFFTGGPTSSVSMGNDKGPLYFLDGCLWRANLLADLLDDEDVGGEMGSGSSMLCLRRLGLD
jgi:hypothetical protein